jgi:D-xylose transport system substrate-binding protein
MGKGLAALAAVGLLAGGCTACDGGGTDADGRGGSSVAKVGIILPDTASSQRWGSDDPKFLRAAFDAAGVEVDIQNAQGDKSQFQTIAEAMISSGVRVLLIVNLDSGTGKAVLDRARAAGVATIDYDRLTLNGGAQYYVSFDNVAVGRLQGEGLVRCLTDMRAARPVIAQLNGSPTDNNATLLKQGYDAVLAPRFAAGEYVKGPDQPVPDWDNAQGGTIFEQMLTERPEIKGVVAANDGLGNAVISVLRKQSLNGKVPVTGQDATVQGLQNILAGDQCMTVFKDIKQEADAAAELAIALAKGEKRAVAQSIRDPDSGASVPAVLLTPRAIYKSNVKDVVAEGFVTKEQLCTGDFAKLCADNGIA